MTDNRVRTVADVRHAFAKYGGNLGTDGSVAFLFKHSASSLRAGHRRGRDAEVALDAGADDVVMNDDDGSIEVLTAPESYQSAARRDGKGRT